jgi:hypothetical protein
VELALLRNFYLKYLGCLRYFKCQAAQFSGLDLEAEPIQVYLPAILSVRDLQLRG